MATSRFYPSLSSIIQIDDLPEQLNFIQEGLDAMFENLYYKDLQFAKSSAGDEAFYSITVLSHKQLGITLPGLELRLILNPGFNNTESSEFPITVNYRLPIVGLIRNFKLSTFLDNNEGLYGLINDLFRIADDALILQGVVLNESGAAPFDDFVDKINATYSLSVADIIPYPSGSGDEEKALEISDAIISNVALVALGKTPQQVIYDVYLLQDVIEHTKEQIDYLFSSVTGGSVVSYVKDLLIPRVDATIALSAGIEFPRNILIPLDENGEPIEDENAKVILLFEAGEFTFSTVSGIGFAENLTLTLSNPAQIGNTGLTIDFNTAKLDLSRKSNIPEATLAGYSNDFTGVFIDEATIGLPPKLFKNNPDQTNPPEVAIRGRNLLIGTGGISGTIGLETTGSPFSAKIGNMTVSLEAFDVTFRQGAITASNIFGKLVIPGFKDSQGNDAEIMIDVHIGDDGDFSITARETEGIRLTVPNILAFVIKSAEIGRKDDKLYIAVSGLLEFEDQGGFLGKFLPSEIDIKKLLIWEDGSIEIEGGSLVLPKAITLKLGPAEISITGIHMGTHEQNLNGVRRKYRYFGFDGGISVNPGGIDARGDGVKFYYTIDSGSRHCFMRIESMAIDIVLPVGAPKSSAAVLISGYLSMKQPEGNDPDAGRELAGGVKIVLPKPGIAGSAAMRYNPKVPSFIVDVSLELPVPIVVFPPVGIYGFRGLFGRRYVASRQHIGLAADASWYLYYKKKVFPENSEGVYISKFDKNKEGFSLGVGASIATSGDNGYTFSSKVFFLLSLPEIILIQGQAAILKTRLGLDTTSDPPFSALIAISRDSVEAAFGVNYKLPDSGAILQVDALMEMAFFKRNASAWYINVGRETPENKRVQAKILSLFNMYSYLMLSSQGIRMGAGVKFELKKKFGPIRVELGAYIDLMGRINFKPVQLGGAIYIGGYARLKIFRFKFGLSVDAGLAAEAPKPFIISGFIKLCIRVLRRNRCIKIDFTFTFNRTLDTSEIRILELENVVAVNIATGETFPLNLTTSGGAIPPSLSQWARSFDLHVVPMDSHIDIEFSKSIGLGAAVTSIGKAAQAYVNFEVIPPQKGKSPQVRHTYTVEEVKIWSLVDGTNNQWQPYNIYNALTPLQDAEFVDDATLANLKEGWLQLDSDGKYKRLRMLSLSPLSYVNQGVDIGNFTLEDLGLTEQDLFCPPANIPKTCFNYASKPLGMTIIPNRITSASNLLVRVLVPRVTSPRPAVVNAANPFGLSRGLMLNPGDQYEMVFKKPIAVVDLQLSTASEYVTVSYYKLEQIGETVSRQPQYGYTLISMATYQPTGLLNPVSYENVDVPVNKVVVTAGSCSGGGGGGGGTGGGGGGGGGTGGGGGGGGGHDCHCDCVSCCGSAPNAGIPSRDGNEVDYLLDLYNETIRQRDLLTVEISSKQRELALNTLSHSRLTGLPAASNVQKNDNVLQAGSYLFKKATLQKEKATLQNKLSTLDDLISKLQPLVSLVNSTGNKNSAEAKALANNILNGVGQTADFTCKTLFFQVCYLSVEDYLRNRATPTTEEIIFDLSSITDGYAKTIHPLWRPDTTYAISVKTKDALTVPERSSANRNYERYFHFGFRTKGPIGHFHSFVKRYQDLKTVDREDEFQLATLRPYLDYAKSYPNADGRLTNAKPLFYGEPKLYLYYKFAYLYNMYGNFGPYNGNPARTGSLKVLIKDPVEPPGTDPEQVIEQTGVGFVTNTISVQQPDISFFNNLTRGSNCVQVVPVNPIGINTVVDPGPLDPQKLYSAIFLARYDGKDQEVHRFVFQTSRYEDFSTQINSYKLHDDDGVFLRNALYDNLGKAFSAEQLTKASQLLTGTLPDTDPLFTTYQDPFDVLMTGIFGMEALPAAVTTEVNIIRNTSDNTIVGLLVRNPEPLNDPKIPATVLGGSVSLSVNGGPATDHKAIFSKDITQVFISNAGLNLAAGPFAFTFRYYQFNGAEYQELDSVSVNLTM